MSRYIQLQGNIYFDTRDKTIVQNLGNRFVFLRHDRRRKFEDVKEEKRREFSAVKGLIHAQGNLYYDPKTKELYKKSGNNLVLYTKDRRKTSKKITIERRKK